jgi:CheY-like chemotaxis protein
MTSRVILCILEDDDVQIEVIKLSIKLAIPDCIVRLAEDGEKFLEVLVTTPVPNMVLLDYNTPKLSGLEVLKIIRSRSDLDWLPIVMFSSDGSSQRKLECKLAGANAFEVKPPMQQMGAALSEIVNKYAYKGELPTVILPILKAKEKPVADNVEWDDLINSL